MKYFIPLLILCGICDYASAQNINPVYEINRYTVPGKESVTEAKTSALHTKAEAAALACKCKVPFRTQGYYDGSFLKSSSSKSSSSSVSSSASSQSSSSLPAIVRVPLTFGRPVERENGDVLSASEIKYYLLERDGGFSRIESQADVVTVEIPALAENENAYLTTVDMGDLFSKRVAVEK